MSPLSFADNLNNSPTRLPCTSCLLAGSASKVTNMSAQETDSQCNADIGKSGSCPLSPVVAVNNVASITVRLMSTTSPSMTSCGNISRFGSPLLSLQGESPHANQPRMTASTTASTELIVGINDDRLINRFASGPLQKSKETLMFD